MHVSTDTQAGVTAADRSAIDPKLRIASVELAVADLRRSADFYERVLGMPVLSRTEQTTALGFDGENPLLRLAALDDPVQTPSRSTGLFHVAWLHPSRSALADTVHRVIAAGWQFDGASDHGVSEALYLSDPDGLGIELYADRPREQWQRPADGRGVRMYTLPLDIQDLLSQGAQMPGPLLAEGSFVGHVHLKVSDVPRAAAFYRDTLGFDEEAQFPGAAFLAAGGYHHHIGLNSWQSAGAGPAPENAPGLRRVRFTLADPGALATLERSLTAAAGAGQSGTRAADGTLSVRDPDAHLLTFAARPS